MGNFPGVPNFVEVKSTTSEDLAFITDGVRNG